MWPVQRNWPGETSLSLSQSQFQSLSPSLRGKWPLTDLCPSVDVQRLLLFSVLHSFISCTPSLPPGGFPGTPMGAAMCVRSVPPLSLLALIKPMFVFPLIGNTLAGAARGSALGLHSQGSSPASSSALLRSPGRQGLGVTPEEGPAAP